MFYWFIQQTIISIIFIFVVHQIYNFIKNKYSIPIVVDLVDMPKKEYANILNIINTSSEESAEQVENTKSVENMKSVETKSSDDGTTSIECLDKKKNTDMYADMYTDMQVDLQSHFNSIK